jgi:hypothetical protein
MLPVRINGEHVVDLHRDGYTWILLRPGAYSLTTPNATLSDRPLAHPLDFTVAAETTYCLYVESREIYLGTRLSGVLGGIPMYEPNKTIARVWQLRDVENNLERLEWRLGDKLFQPPERREYRPQ